MSALNPMGSPVALRCPSPCDASIRTAGERSCDLTVIASHGRKGTKSFRRGRETQGAGLYA